MTCLFAVESILIPAVLLLRFAVLAPVAFLIPQLHRWLMRHFSSLIASAIKMAAKSSLHSVVP